MLFSVVIPTFNRLEFLPRTLESVFTQTFTGFELIVVDDGSTDGTAHYLATLQDRLTVLSQAQEGAGAARNLGIAHAHGEYVVLLDSDDLWFPWTLSAFARAVSEGQSPAFVAASVRDFTNERELEGMTEQPLRFAAYPNYLASAGAALLAGSGSIAVRRDWLREIGGFTRRRLNCEDQDLVLRLGVSARFVAVSSPPMVAWRHHPGGLTSNIDRAIEGGHYLIEQERHGHYPGGESYARARREIIARSIRPLVFHCLRRGRLRDAWRLYASTLNWHIGIGRWRFILGFPLIAIATTIRRASGLGRHT